MKPKFLLICLLNLVLFAADLSLDSFRANFIQTLKNEQGKITYRGEVFFDNPSSLFVYESPEKKRVLVRENEILILDDELEQAIFTRQEMSLNSLLKSAKKINENEFISEIDGIKYHIFFKDKKIDFISYKDELDNYVKIQLYNFVYQKINDEIFDIKVPKDYDIMR